MEQSFTQDLLECIFVFLPISSLARFRCVSRLCNSIITSFRFSNKRSAQSKIHGEDVWFVFNSLRDEMADFLDVRTLQWCRIDVQNLATHAVAADAGLVLISAHHVGIQLLYLVWNPLTRKFRVLPKNSLIERPTICGFAVDPHTNAYKVLLTGRSDLCSSGEMISSMYDSTSGSWCGGGPSQDRSPFKLEDSPYHSKSSVFTAIFSAGKFYTVTKFSMKCYEFDEQTMIWSLLPSSCNLRGFPLRNPLMGGEAQLVQFSWLYRNPLPFALHSITYQVGKKAMEWQESSDLLREFAAGRHARGDVYWDFLQIFSACRNKLWIRTGSCNGYSEFVYDMLHHVLQVCPACPFEPTNCVGFIPSFWQVP